MADETGVKLLSTEADRPAERPPLIDTAELFGGKTEIRLLHRGSEYRLRITKLGKLILTK